jgi:hypothetical protein
MYDTLLFKDIMRKSEETNSEPVLKMRDWLRLLVAETYDVDLEDLKK